MGLDEDKRCQIITAAVEEFRERGYSAASMDRVAATANVSKRTVYNHFDSKEALFRAIIDVMAKQVGQALDVAYVPGRPIREQLLELGWSEGRLLTSTCFMKLARMVMGETMRDPVLAEEMSQRFARIPGFEAFFAAARDDGAIEADDIELATKQFLGLIKSQAFWPAIHSGVVLSDEQMGVVVESSVDMFLSHYRPRA